MIDPPCTVMVNRIFPEVKKRTARELRSGGWKQKEIASALGVTQAMVSRYLSSEVKEFPLEMEKGLAGMVYEMVDMIKGKRSDAEIISAICKNCFSVRESGSLCSLHPVKNCRVCMNIRSHGVVGKRKEVLDDVRAAVMVLEGRLSPEIIPEVRINIASALPDADGPAGVVAIPGRMVEIRGEIKALTEPEFGASQHLSLILLKAMKLRPDIRGVVNILFGASLERVLADLNLPFTEFDGENIPDGWNDLLLAYRGAYGREPCLYVFGKSAEEAAGTVRKMSDRMGAVE